MFNYILSTTNSDTDGWVFDTDAIDNVEAQIAGIAKQGHISMMVHLLVRHGRSGMQDNMMSPLKN